MKTIDADIQSLLFDGADPASFRLGLARIHRVDVAEIDAAIARLGGSPADVSLAQVADRYRDQDRRGRHTSAYRAYSHEEE